MILVDIDVEIDRVCNEICGCDREQCRWKAYGKEEGCNPIQELEKANAVDAIPVEWLRDKMRGYASSLKSTETAALVMVMQMWQKEQEAHGT